MTKKQLIEMKYNERKLNTGSARVCRWFGFHYIHTGRRVLFILFSLSLCVGIGIIRWIIQAFTLNSEIQKKNDKILQELYTLYQ